MNATIQRAIDSAWADDRRPSSCAESRLEGSRILVRVISHLVRMDAEARFDSAGNRRPLSGAVLDESLVLMSAVGRCSALLSLVQVERLAKGER